VRAVSLSRAVPSRPGHPWRPRLRVAPLTATLLLAGGAASAQTTALVGGTVVDGTGGPAIPNAVVVVTGDRLSCVGTPARCPIPASSTRVDVAGRFLTPGLVDAHVHLARTGWLDGRTDPIDAPESITHAAAARAVRADPARWYRADLCSGVTAVLDAGGPAWTTALPRRAEHDSVAPHVRATGPVLTPAPRVARRAGDELDPDLPMATSADVRASVATLKAMGASAVSVRYPAPVTASLRELDARLAEIARTARAAGLDLIVETSELRVAKAALRAGAVMLAHGVEDEPADDEFLTLLQTTHAVYVPTLLAERAGVRAIASVVLGTRHPIDDPGGCVDSATVATTAAVAPLRLRVRDFAGASTRVLRDLDDAEVKRAMLADNLRRVAATGATIVAGTDAGDPLVFHGASMLAELEAMQAAGLPAADVVVMATRNGARAMRRSRDFGTLEAGKLADLLVLAEDPRKNVQAFRSATHVVRRGRIYERAALAQRR
jgi:imidazolonepropionase-like amidohydrolase